MTVPEHMPWYARPLAINVPLSTIWPCEKTYMASAFLTFDSQRATATVVRLLFFPAMHKEVTGIQITI